MPAPVRVIASVSCCERAAICSTVWLACSAKPCATWSSRVRHHLLQAGGHVGEFVVDVVGLEVEAGGQPRRWRR